MGATMPKAGVFKRTGKSFLRPPRIRQKEDELRLKPLDKCTRFAIRYKRVSEPTHREVPYGREIPIIGISH
jgi:hypothetical protein